MSMKQIKSKEKALYDTEFFFNGKEPVIQAEEVSGILGDHIREAGDLSYILSNLFKPFIDNVTIKNTKVYKKDIEKFQNRDLDDEILDIYDEFCKVLKYNGCDTELLLAGGKVTDYLSGIKNADSVGDYDVWILENNGLSDIFNIISSKIDNSIAFNKNRYYSFKFKEKDFQLIPNDKDAPEEIFEMFDFRCSSVAYDGNYIYWQQKALKDIKHRNLVVKHCDISRCYANRLYKYFKKGFSISQSSFAMIALSTLMGMQGHDNSERSDFFEKLFTNSNFTSSDINGEEYMNITDPILFP